MDIILKPISACLKECWKPTLDSPPAFGRDMRSSQFQLEKGKTFLNHASRGSVPKRVSDAQKRYTFDIITTISIDILLSLDGGISHTG